MKAYMPLMILASLPLAACNQKTGSTTVTTNAATGQVTSSESGSGSQPLNLQPGQWEIKTQVSDLKMTDMPKGISSNPPAQTSSVCITPEQAAKGPADFMKQAKSDCTATSSTYSGGKIETDVTCKMPGGETTMHVKTTGSYTATTLVTDAALEMSGPHAMSQKVHTDGHRTGECSSPK